MKTLEKGEMLERNKVQRVLAEAAILNAIDHPFLASLWGTIVTKTHLHFLMEVCFPPLHRPVLSVTSKISCLIGRSCSLHASLQTHAQTSLESFHLLWGMFV